MQKQIALVIIPYQSWVQSILVMDCMHHENVHEVILGSPDLGLFYLCNIACKGFLDTLMLVLISTISLTIMTTDEM